MLIGILAERSLASSQGVISSGELISGAGLIPTAWDQNLRPLSVRPSSRIHRKIAEKTRRFAKKARPSRGTRKAPNLGLFLHLGGMFWRRGSGSNRRIKVLQTSPLPLGYRAFCLLHSNPKAQENNFHYEVYRKRRGNLERETGVEPATSSLARKHSTTELLPPCQD